MSWSICKERFPSFKQNLCLDTVIDLIRLRTCRIKVTAHSPCRWIANLMTNNNWPTSHGQLPWRWWENKHIHFNFLPTMKREKIFKWRHWIKNGKQRRHRSFSTWKIYNEKKSVGSFTVCWQFGGCCQTTDDVRAAWRPTLSMFSLDYRSSARSCYYISCCRAWAEWGRTACLARCIRHTGTFLFQARIKTQNEMDRRSQKALE